MLQGVPRDGAAAGYHRGEGSPAVPNVEPWRNIADGEDNNKEAYETVEEHDDDPKMDDDRANIGDGEDKNNAAVGRKDDAHNTAEDEPNLAEALVKRLLPFSLHRKKKEKLNWSQFLRFLVHFLLRVRSDGAAVVVKPRCHRPFAIV